MHRRHILGMSTSPLNDCDCQKLCRLSCSSITNTPPSTLPKSAVLGPAKPRAEIQKFFAGVRMWKAIHVCCFKKWSKSVQAKWPKGHVALITKKQNTFWHRGAETLGQFSPIFLCECVPWPLTYIPDFIHIGSGLGKL